MITQESWMDIRLLYRQGMSIRQIARRTGFSRRTVRKVLSEPTPKQYGPRPKRPSKLDPYVPYLCEQLVSRPWLRSTQLFEEIRQRGYPGHYELVKIFARKHREEERARRRATVRFETRPGEEGQFDWKGPVSGLLRDEPDRIVYIFRLVLAFSRLRVSLVALSQKLPEVLSDLRTALERLGGVPRRIVFDNFKAAVCTPRPHLALQSSFLDFCRAYGMEPDPALPYTPQRKGKVERSFSDFVDPDLLHRSYDTLEALQSALTEDDRRHAERLHSTTGQLPRERFEKERPFLLPLPAVPFDPRIPEARRVLSDCTISFLAARYSVPYRLVGSAVTVKADPKNPKIDVFHNADLVASHPLVPKGQQHILEEHVAELRRCRWDRLKDRNQKSTPAPLTQPGPALHPLVPWNNVEVVQRPITEYQAVAEGVQ